MRQRDGRSSTFVVAADGLAAAESPPEGYTTLPQAATIALDSVQLSRAIVGA